MEDPPPQEIWSELSDTQRDAAVLLGYSQDTWDICKPTDEEINYVPPNPCKYVEMETGPRVLVFGLVSALAGFFSGALLRMGLRRRPMMYSNQEQRLKILRQWGDRDGQAFTLLVIFDTVLVVLIFARTQTADPKIQAAFFPSAMIGLGILLVLPVLQLLAAIYFWKSQSYGLAEAMGAPECFMDPVEAFRLLEMERQNRAVNRSSLKQQFAEKKQDIHMDKLRAKEEQRVAEVPASVASTPMPAMMPVHPPPLRPRQGVAPGKRPPPFSPREDRVTPRHSARTGGLTDDKNREVMRPPPPPPPNRQRPQIGYEGKSLSPQRGTAARKPPPQALGDSPGGGYRPNARGDNLALPAPMPGELPAPMDRGQIPQALPPPPPNLG